MRKIKLVGAGLAAATILGAGLSASAQAQPLPEFKFENVLSGTSSTAKIYTAEITSVACKAGKLKLTVAKNTFAVSLTECNEGGEECHSLGDAAGAVLITGEWRLVRLASERVGLWLLPAELHVECPKGLVKLFMVKGSALGSLTPILSLTSELELVLKAPSGKQEISEYETDTKGEKAKAGIEVSQEGGKAKAGGIELTEAKLKVGAEVTILETT